MPVEVRACGFVIFRRFPVVEYLLMQASYGTHHWTPPKGHVEAGESDLDTAFRETAEEAGLLKEHLKIHEEFRKSLYYNANGKEKESVYFLAELKDKDTPVKLSHEHQAFKWAPLQEAVELANFDTLKELLNCADKFINENAK